MIKMLLATTENVSSSSKLALRNMYGVVADAPMEVEAKIFSVNSSSGSVHDEIVRGGYDIVYLQCDADNENGMLRTAEAVKKALPASIIVLGGVQVSYDTEEFMLLHPETDYVIRGEGEQVFFNFIRTILTGEFDFAGIAGLAYWEEDKVVVNPLAEPLEPGDIPFPYERSELEDYSLAYYETFRGCPDSCAYSSAYPDATIRLLPFSRVLKEIDNFIDRQFSHVTVVDKWFNFIPSRALAVWEHIIAKDRGVTTFEFDINGDLLDGEAVSLLANAREGLFEFNVDIESTNAESLAAMGRKENIYPLLFNVSKLLRDTDVRVNVFQKIGMPYETSALFARSFDKIYELGADSMHVDVMRLLRGTYLRSEADLYGYVCGSSSPYEVISNEFMSSAELVRIKMASDTAMRFMGSEFKRTLARMRKDTSSKPFELFMKLGEYIYRNGLSCMMWKRANMYRILYAFATSLYDDKNETLKLRELMQILHEELEANMPESAVERFDRKGWELNV